MVARERIGWGIIGCGWVARDYVAPGILACNNSCLLALCDRDADALAAIAPEASDAHRTSSLESFLATPGLDAVYVATPNDSHRTLTEAAARAGKHVFCEKPMATRYDDAAAMVRACKDAGVMYATAFDQRFQARHIALRELIQSGALGTITIVRIHYACWLPADWAEDNWRIDPARAGGGAWMDLAPHGLDLMQSLLGEGIEEMHVMLQQRVHDYSVDDGAVAIGRLSSGTLMHINVAYNCRDVYPRRTLEIIGTEARAEAVNTMGQTPGGELFVTNKNGERREILVDDALDVSPFQKGIEVFADCLLRGEPFPFAPEGDLHTARLLEVAREKSASVGEPSSEASRLRAVYPAASGTPLDMASERGQHF